MVETLVEKNLQLRIALSEDVGRHIHESMQEWRNTLKKYSITLQDIRKQVECDHLSRDDAFNEIEALLSRFHEGDGTFERYHSDSKYLMDIHKASVDMTLPGDLQHLVDDWYNLKASLNSVPESYSNTTEIDSEGKTINPENESAGIVDGMQLDFSADVQVEATHVDTDIKADTPVTTVEAVHIDTTSDVQVEASHILTEVDFHIPLVFAEAVQIDISTNTQIEATHIDTEIERQPQALTVEALDIEVPATDTKTEADMPVVSVEAVPIDSTSDVHVKALVEVDDADTLLEDSIGTNDQIEPVSVNLTVPCAVEALKREVEEETLILPAEVAVVESCPDFDLEVNGEANAETEVKLINDISDKKSSAEYVDNKPPRRYDNFCVSFCCCFVTIAVAVLLRFFSTELDVY